MRYYMTINATSVVLDGDDPAIMVHLYGPNGVGFPSVKKDIFGYFETEKEVCEEIQKDLGLIPCPAPTYYPISEENARRAKQAISWSDYKAGSATEEYRLYVDKASLLAKACKDSTDPMYHDQIDRLLDTYARKLAENINAENANTASCPSVMIAGPANFPVRKKEKQNARAATLMDEWNQIQGLLDKMRSVGRGGISSDDPNALAKLKAKMEKLQKAQETMKNVNAWYRQNKTVIGCPYLSEENAAKLDADMKSQWHMEDKPFQSYELSNNGAEIRRLAKRIEALEKRESEPTPEGWEFYGGKVVVNKALNRLQVIFDDKPDAETREELKGNGFRWAPSQNAWQRQYTENAMRAARRCKCLQPED